MHHLGIDRYEHFASNRTDLIHIEDVHIPIRHPMDVARSWACRPKHDIVDRLIGSYDMMFECINNSEPTLHRIEDIPTVLGKGEHSDGDHEQLIREVRAAVLQHVVLPHQSFFDRYY